jgi:histidinol dehydrogenase
MAISFNTDSLSTELKKINPSSIELKSPKIKTFDIKQTIENVTPQIKSKVTSAVENFKNLKTGQLPEISIPEIDVSSYIEAIDDKVSQSLESLADIRSKLNVEKLKKEINFKSQLDSIDIEKISSDEVAKFQGDMFGDIKSSVKGITNNQLRDFNVDIANQQKVVNDITSNVLESGKVAAEKGISNAEKAKAQLKSVDTLDSLVDKKNIFI